MSVALDIQGCDAPSEIIRIVEIELGQQVAPTEAAGGLRIEVACDAQAARILVEDVGVFSARSVELGDVTPSARARLIALAAVELVSRSKPSDPAPAPARAATESIDGGGPRDRARPRLVIAAFGGGVAFDSNTGLLGGGGLRLSRAGTPVGWLVDVRAHHGTSAVPLGLVTANVVDAGAAVAIGRTTGPVYLALAGGARGGAVRLAGTSDEAMVRSDAFWAPWFGGFALANIEVRVRARMTMQLAIEGGYVISPVGALVDDTRAVGIDGPWIGIHLGIGTIL